MPSAAPTVVIVGSGFAGIAAAIALRRAGVTGVTILERSDEIGGVWRENTYPGAACDVPAPLYSFSFAPSARWSRRYAGQAEIKAYLQETASQYGVDRDVRYRIEATAAEFDDARGRWTVHTSTGEVFEADVLIAAVGQLSRPALPAIPGLSSFAGAAFHSAQWRHDVDLRARDVAVIGTGASAIQFVPEIAPSVGSLRVFQRTAPYLAPKFDTSYGRLHKLLRSRVRASALPGRALLWLFCEWCTRGMTGSRRIAALMSWVCLNKLRREVRDDALRARLRPDYPVGCKRVLFSNDYLPALTRTNVSVVTEPITEITPTGLRTADGADHRVDVIIYGTGFTATDFLAPMKIRGLDGRDLSDAWSEGARAYLGITVAGFPNLFLMYGPNTNLGAGSIIYMLEAQARYIAQAAGVLAGKASAYLDVRSDVADRFDAEMQRRLATAVWSSCRSWYRTPGGRVTTNWPGQVYEYHRRTRTFDVTDYRLVPIDARSAP